MNINIFGLLKFAEYEYIWYHLNWPNMNMNMYGTMNMNIYTPLTKVKYKYEYIVKQ